MLVLLTTLVITCKNVSAKSYVADDNITISSSFHDVFNNYFDESKKYTYFAYKCDNRTCYFGIDEDNNYLEITYTGTQYNNQIVYKKGTDNNFSVSGVNVFNHNPSANSQLLYAFVFSLVFVVFFKLFKR